MYPLVAPAAQYIPPTSSFFYLLYEISVIKTVVIEKAKIKEKPAKRTVWPDLAKFHHFGKYLKIFGNIFKVYLVLGNVFNSIWQYLYAIGHIFITENEWPIIEDTIWSSGHTAHESPILKELKSCMSLRLGHYVKEMSIEEVACPVWPDWAILFTLGNFSKPVATIILPKLPIHFRQFL